MNATKVPLRSIHDSERSFVQFINTTKYIVEIYWVNYKGQAVHYSTLRPAHSLNINTYATHPWIFVERETKDRFMVQGKNVFFPQPSRYRDVPESNDLPERIERVQVFITVPIYSLRDISLRVIKRLLRDDIHAFRLDIPVNLQRELASMLPRKSIETEPTNSDIQ